MRRFLHLLAWWPVERMLRVACWLGLVALGLMIWGVVSGRPVPVVLSMSLAQMIGVLACLLFGLSIAADAGRAK